MEIFYFSLQIESNRGIQNLHDIGRKIKLDNDVFH